MATFQPFTRNIKRKESTVAKEGKDKHLPISQKRSFETVADGEKKKDDKKLNDHIEKLDGFSELVIQKFEELFQQSSELTVGCSHFSGKDILNSFPELESEAIGLVKKKDDVSSSMETLFQEYRKEELPSRAFQAFLRQKESGLLIEQSQKAINDCRALMNEVKEKRKTF